MLVFVGDFYLFAFFSFLLPYFTLLVFIVSLSHFCRLSVARPWTGTAGGCAMSDGNSS